jgi:hypothetical protein
MLADIENRIIIEMIVEKWDYCRVSDRVDEFRAHVSREMAQCADVPKSFLVI